MKEEDLKAKGYKTSTTASTSTSASTKERNMFVVGMIGGFLVPIFLVLAIVPFLLIDGILFSKIWQWWVADTFGVRRLTLVEAMGISLIVAYFRYNVPSDKDASWKNLLSNLGKDLLVFFVAWVLTLFK